MIVPSATNWVNLVCNRIANDTIPLKREGSIATAETKQRRSVLSGGIPKMDHVKRGRRLGGVRIDRDIGEDINLHKSEEQRLNLSRS